MKIEYDSEVDVLSFLLTSEKIEESDEVCPGMIVDYNEEGKIVGIEILDASRVIQDFNQLKIELTVDKNTVLSMV